MNTGMPQTPWPPRWARTLAFLVGIGLMTWETTVDQSAHLVAYGPAFLLTGLPIARGAEKFIDALPWVKSTPDPPPHDPDDPLEGW